MTGPVGHDSSTAAERISERILAFERRRRSAPDAGDHKVAGPPMDWPPLSVLADRCFPAWVLDRRDRFFAASGHGPATGRPVRVLTSLEDLIPGPWSAEDYVAAVRACPSVTTSDPFLAALARALGVPCEGPEAPPDAVARIDGWLDRHFGAPAPGRSLDLPSAWGRLEAVTASADRRFGRSGPLPHWDLLSAGLWRLGEIKRRLRP